MTKFCVLLNLRVPPPPSMCPKMGCFCPFLFFGVNYLEYICSSYYKGFWAISPTIWAKNEVEIVENRLKMVSADTIFAPFLGPFGPKLCHLVPPYGPLWYWWKKVVRDVEIRCFSTKIGPKNLYSQLSPLFISVVDFYCFYIFSYNFKPIWIKPFAFSSQSDGLPFCCSEF